MGGRGSMRLGFGMRLLRTGEFWGGCSGGLPYFFFFGRLWMLTFWCLGRLRGISRRSRSMLGSSVWRVGGVVGKGCSGLGAPRCWFLGCSYTYISWSRRWGGCGYLFKDGGFLELTEHIYAIFRLHLGSLKSDTIQGGVAAPAQLWNGAARRRCEQNISSCCVCVCVCW